jgi:hypothetical protein
MYSVRWNVHTASLTKLCGVGPGHRSAGFTDMSSDRIPNLQDGTKPFEHTHRQCGGVQKRGEISKIMFHNRGKKGLGYRFKDRK